MRTAAGRCLCEGGNYENNPTEKEEAVFAHRSFFADRIFFPGTFEKLDFHNFSQEKIFKKKFKKFSKKIFKKNFGRPLPEVAGSRNGL